MKCCPSAPGWLPFLPPFISTLVSLHVRQLLGWDDMADLAAGIVVFVISVIVMSLVTHYASAALQGSGLSAVDRSLISIRYRPWSGIGLLLYLGLNWLIEDGDYPQWVTEARTLPLVERGAETL